MQGSNTNIDLNTLFRFIDVPQSPPRPQSAIDFDRKSGENYNRYITQLHAHNYGFERKGLEQEETYSDNGDE